MKKIVTISIIIIILISIISISANIIAIYVETSKILEFEMTEQEYNYYKNERSILKEEKIVGPVKNLADVRKQAELIFSEFFGEEEAKSRKPYIVAYDKKTKIWHIVGDKKTILPGVAVLSKSLHLLITEDEGKVISLWK